MSQLKAISVKILGKDFQVTCPSGSEDSLKEAARYLDEKMSAIRATGRVFGLERIGIMAALNISHELLSHRHQKETYVHSVTEQIERLQNKIDEALIEASVSESED